MNHITDAQFMYVVNWVVLIAFVYSLVMFAFKAVNNIIVAIIPELRAQVEEIDDFFFYPSDWYLLIVSAVYLIGMRLF